MAVDPGAEVRWYDLAFVKDVRALFEVPDPQGVGPIPRPASPYRLTRDAELDPCCTGVLQEPIQCRFGQRRAVPRSQELVNRFIGTLRLVPFQVDGLVDDLLFVGPRTAAVGAALAGQAIEARSAVLPQLAPQRGQRRILAHTVGEQMFSLCDLIEEALRVRRIDVPEEHGLKQRAPEDRPFLVLTSHHHLRPTGRRRSSLDAMNTALPSGGKSKL